MLSLATACGVTGSPVANDASMADAATPEDDAGMGGEDAAADGASPGRDGSIPDDAGPKDAGTGDEDAGEGDAGPRVVCSTRVTYGPAWFHPENHPENFDVTAGYVTWDGVCNNDGTNSYAVLSNDWMPFFMGIGTCSIVFEYTYCP